MNIMNQILIQVLKEEKENRMMMMMIITKVDKEFNVPNSEEN